MEYYEFRLAKESLREREILCNIAPHIVWPLRFVLPHTKDLRPAWLLRLGLFLYDSLAYSICDLFSCGKGKHKKNCQNQ